MSVVPSEANAEVFKMCILSPEQKVMTSLVAKISQIVQRSEKINSHFFSPVKMSSWSQSLFKYSSIQHDEHFVNDIHLVKKNVGLVYCN